MRKEPADRTEKLSLEQAKPPVDRTEGERDGATRRDIHYIMRNAKICSLMTGVIA